MKGNEGSTYDLVCDPSLRKVGSLVAEAYGLLRRFLIEGDEADGMNLTGTTFSHRAYFGSGNASVGLIGP